MASGPIGTRYFSKSTPESGTNPTRKARSTFFNSRTNNGFVPCLRTIYIRKYVNISEKNRKSCFYQTRIGPELRNKCRMTEETIQLCSFFFFNAKLINTRFNFGDRVSKISSRATRFFNFSILLSVKKLCLQSKKKKSNNKQQMTSRSDSMEKLHSLCLIFVILSVGMVIAFLIFSPTGKLAGSRKKIRRFPTA